MLILKTLRNGAGNYWNRWGKTHSTTIDYIGLHVSSGTPFDRTDWQILEIAMHFKIHEN